jgi:hypothetical protein
MILEEVDGLVVQSQLSGQRGKGVNHEAVEG